MAHGKISSLSFQFEISPTIYWSLGILLYKCSIIQHHLSSVDKIECNCQIHAHHIVNVNWLLRTTETLANYDMQMFYIIYSLKICRWHYDTPVHINMLMDIQKKKLCKIIAVICFGASHTRINHNLGFTVSQNGLISQMHI